MKDFVKLAVAIASLVATISVYAGGGVLSVQTSVPSKIYIDNEYIGETPYPKHGYRSIHLPAGTYEVVASSPYDDDYIYYAKFDSVKIAAGKITKLPILMMLHETKQGEEKRLKSENNLEVNSLISGSMFIDNGGATVVDERTGLEWMRCSYGQSWDSVSKKCTGRAWEIAWDRGQAFAKQLEFGGHSDWRIPTQTELLSLVFCSSVDPNDLDSVFETTGNGCKKTTNGPAIDLNVFPGSCARHYIAHSDDARMSYGAYIKMRSGIRYTADGSAYGCMRLVRG